ncbi:MAG: HNH endonuclease [Spirochaetales bacterium]|nr:HNH endonuclease [Spirochaetales bacterium]
MLAGGYNARSRRIPDSIRKEVIRRDNGRCRVCGKPGNQIDHIRGNSSDINNLQLLCLNCHNKKTMANLKPISPDSHPEKYAHAEALLSRVHTSKPLRLCDGTDWSKNWRKILKARKEMGKKMINIRNKNASLFMRKNRHYWHFYYWGRDEKRHCISTGESLKDKAEQFMKQFLTDLEKR